MFKFGFLKTLEKISSGLIMAPSIGRFYGGKSFSNSGHSPKQYDEIHSRRGPSQQAEIKKNNLLNSLAGGMTSQLRKPDEVNTSLDSPKVNTTSRAGQIGKNTKTKGELQQSNIQIANYDPEFQNQRKRTRRIPLGFRRL